MYSLTPIYVVSGYDANASGFFGVMLIIIAFLLLRMVGSNDILAPKTKKGEFHLTIAAGLVSVLGACMIGFFIYARLHLVDKLVPQHEVRAVLTGTLAVSKSTGVLAIYTTDTNEVVAFTLEYGKSAKQEVTLYTRN